MTACARSEAPARGLESFEVFAAGAAEALAAAGARVHGIELGDMRIALRFAGAALEPLLLPAFAHAARTHGGEPDLTVDVWDSATTGVAVPLFPWHPHDVRERGEIAGSNDERFRTVFHGDLLAPHDDFRAVSVFSAERRHAVLWVLAPERVPWWERAAPLRTILHWALGSPPRRVLLHAAGVATGGRGALLAGAGGSGKSTTAVACLEAGFDCAGDDYVLLDAGGAPVAHPIYGTAKLEPRSLALLPGAAAAARAADGVDGEKRVLDLARLSAQRIGRSVPVDALVVPRVAPGPTRLERASGAEALRALAPTTIFQLPGRNGPVLAMLAALARRVPTYSLTLGGPPAEGVRALRDLLAAT